MINIKKSKTIQRNMKTFEGQDIARGSGVESRVVIFFMYLLRALSATFIIFLVVYMLARTLGFGEGITFWEFVWENLLVALLFLAFLLGIQLVLRGRRRSVSEVVVGYAIPLIAIAVALYVVHTIEAI